MPVISKLPQYSIFQLPPQFHIVERLYIANPAIHYFRIRKEKVLGFKRTIITLESLGRLSIMIEAFLRKRDRQPKALADSIDVQEPKRFHGEETDWFLHLLQLDQTLTDDDEEEFAPSEELVNSVMRSLEEEIAETCSTSYPSSISGDNSADPNISRGNEGETLVSDSGVDLCYLLEASDDELGIPPSPVMDLKKEVCQSSKEASEGLGENRDLKSIGENRHFEDDCENYQQCTLYDNSWDAIQFDDYINRDFLSQAMLFEGDFSAACRLEIAGGM